MRKLTEMLKDAGISYDASYFEPHVQLETVERCRVCKKGFKSQWGYIYSCKDHEFLEEVHIPPVFSNLKKKAAEKRKKNK